MMSLLVWVEIVEFDINHWHRDIRSFTHTKLKTLMAKQPVS